MVFKESLGANDERVTLIPNNAGPNRLLGITLSLLDAFAIEKGLCP